VPGAKQVANLGERGAPCPAGGRDGRELFYAQGITFMSVAIATQPTFSPGPPMALFTKASLQNGYDVSKDGKRFILADKPPGEPPLAIHVVHNWFEEFRAQQAGH